MGWRRRIAATLLAAALGACAELTADAPLFTVSDQIGPPPLAEGVWIAVGEDCPAYYARRRTGRLPEACSPLELNRLDDGAWQARLRIDLMSGLSPSDRTEAEETAGPYRLIIVPAVERREPEVYAPLYVAEVTRGEAASEPMYMVIAPIGERPATSSMILLSVGCAAILRDGPIEGVREHYRTRLDNEGTEHRELSSCVATTQAAVREAARRAVIENLDRMPESRYILARPR